MLLVQQIKILDSDGHGWLGMVITEPVQLLSKVVEDT